jgi:hypothetical protein
VPIPSRAILTVPAIHAGLAVVGDADNLVARWTVKVCHGHHAKDRDPDAERDAREKAYPGHCFLFLREVRAGTLQRKAPRQACHDGGALPVGSTHHYAVLSLQSLHTMCYQT